MRALLCVPFIALGAAGRTELVVRSLRGEHPAAPQPRVEAPSAWGQGLLDPLWGTSGAPQSWGDLPGWFLRRDLPIVAASAPLQSGALGKARADAQAAAPAVVRALRALPLWILIVLVLTLGSIVAFICFLIRFIHDGYEVHWMAGLPAQTDFARLSDGDFIKVVGHVVATPGNTLLAPLSQTPCVAYSVDVMRRGPRPKAYTKLSQVKSFCVQDEQGRLLSIQGHEAVLYNLSASRDWTFSPAVAPKEFQPFVPREHRGTPDEPSATPLRFREAVLEVGAKVCCVGTASTLPTPHAPVSLRPAYATLMFRDAQIPWNKLSGLSTADWGKVAASVLVTSYRLGR